MRCIGVVGAKDLRRNGRCVRLEGGVHRDVGQEKLWRLLHRLGFALHVGFVNVLHAN